MTFPCEVCGYIFRHAPRLLRLKRIRFAFDGLPFSTFIAACPECACRVVMAQYVREAA